MTSSRVLKSNTHGGLPPPLWGRGGEGGKFARIMRVALPPSRRALRIDLPLKGGADNNIRDAHLTGSGSI